MKTTSSFPEQSLSVPEWLPEKEWYWLMETITKAVNLRIYEGHLLLNNLVIELLVATAYFSGCKDPRRIAIVHLYTFIASYRCRDLFDHRLGEKLTDHLLPIDYFPGGDKDCVRAGMLLLGLLALNDNKHAMATDNLKNKENSLNKELAYHSEQERLLSEWQSLPQKAHELFGPFYDRVLKAKSWF